MRTQTNIIIENETLLRLKHLALDKGSSVSRLLEEAANQIYFKEQ